MNLLKGLIILLNIGSKIKELRKKNDMTQEKLAEYLNVSFQAISKWETGVATPDLSLIVPLTRLFKVSADERRGISEVVADERRLELREMWNDTYKSGDVAKRLEIAQTAVAEYPGDVEFIYMLAESEFYYPNHNFEYGSDEFREYIEKAVKHYEAVLEYDNNEDFKNAALYGLVLTLPDLGRNDEAVKYAKQHPNGDELLLWCLKGEEKEVQRQELIQRALLNLLSHLEFGQNDLVSIQASEKIAKTIFDDGNYLYMNEHLSFNCYLQAACLTRDGRYEEAIEKMRECYNYALEADKMHEAAKEKPLNYTCHILSKLVFDGNNYTKSGTENNVDNFREFLRRDRLAPLFERDDYKELLEL